MVRMLSTILLLLTFLVPVLPIGKRLYFKSQVERAIDKLEIADYSVNASISIQEGMHQEGKPSDLSNLSDDTTINSLDHQERGFDELKKAIQQHHSVEDNIRKFHLIWGDIGEISEVTGVSLPVSSTATTNGLLCAEYMDGTYDRILFNALDLEDTAKLTEVRTWARETATIESYSLTITLVFLWFVISLLNQ